MSISGYQEAFGAADKTSAAMRKAQEKWREAYYGTGEEDTDPCPRSAYSVVGKLVRTVFGEYQPRTADPFAAGILAGLDARREEILQTVLVNGECFLKPCPEGENFAFTVIPRDNVLVFGRDAGGTPTDICTAEKEIRGNYYYTLLERRYVDGAGCLTIENRLFRSGDRDTLGSPVPLGENPRYADLPESYRYPVPLGGLGLVRMKTPILNCVDGSGDGVAIYAAAMGLIGNIDRNEKLMDEEFERGQSRVFTSADLLDPQTGKLESNLFVGLDEDMEHTGLTVYSPTLRHEAYLERKQEYLRNVESIIGLRRGMLSDANMEDRTATEITSSAGDYNLTVIDLQNVWDVAIRQVLSLCCALGRQYRMPGIPENTPEVTVDWGNGVLYDEDKTWEAYRGMVSDGILKPEVALGWRFNLPTDTEEDLLAIRRRLMPQNEIIC